MYSTRKQGSALKMLHLQFNVDAPVDGRVKWLGPPCVAVWHVHLTVLMSPRKCPQEVSHACSSDAVYLYAMSRATQNTSQH